MVQFIFLLLLSTAMALTCEECIKNNFKFLILEDGDQVCVESIAGFNITMKAVNLGQCIRVNRYLKASAGRSNKK
jgi:hypothetical protein